MTWKTPWLPSGLGGSLRRWFSIWKMIGTVSCMVAGWLRLRKWEVCRRREGTADMRVLIGRHVRDFFAWMNLQALSFSTLILLGLGICSNFPTSSIWWILFILKKIIRWWFMEKSTKSLNVYFWKIEIIFWVYENKEKKTIEN